MTRTAPLAPVVLARVPALAGVADLEARLFALWQSGRDAWPDLDLAPAAFVAHLAERLPPDSARDQVLASLAQLHAADLYLACACLRGVPGAIEAFDRALLAQVPGFLRRVSATAAQIDEVRQALREKLFLAEPGAEPRIAGYSGGGALAAWVRVAAVRTALNLRRDEAARAAPELPEAALVAGEDAELDYVRERYKAEFAEALRESIAALPARQRSALRLRFAHGMTDEKIAATYGVHQTTVTRWIAAAREAVFLGTRRRLAERLQLEAADFESLAGVLRSRLDLSLTTLLGAGDDG